MKRGILMLLIILALTGPLYPQSGRGKKEPAKKTPKPATKSVYVPTQKVKPTPRPTVSPLPSPSPDDSVIKVESALVPIPVSVIDPTTGRALTDLKLTDFRLSVDNKRVEVTELFRSESPVRLALLFDNSSSVTDAREFEQKAAIRFFKRVIRPRTDLASLYSVAAVSRLEQEMTNNVSSLVRSIKSLPQPQGATALNDALVLASNALGSLAGRRVIVVVSDGQDTLSDTAFDEMVKIVQEGNCQVYVVHTNEFENLLRTGRRSGSANLRALAAERRMQTLASQTGGAVYSPVNERELDRAFSQISAELSNQYILGYYPDNERADGRFRKIGLQIRSVRPLIVRARKGYYVKKR